MKKAILQWMRVGAMLACSCLIALSTACSDKKSMESEIDRNFPLPPPAEAVCGDSRVDEGETCDDGNTVAGDGCSEVCQVEEGVVPPSIVIPEQKVSVNSLTSCTAVQGKVYCWGLGTHDQLGQYQQQEFSYAPVLAQQFVTDVAEISVGGRHVCALLRNGTIYCWGDNSFKQLGLPITSYFSQTYVPNHVQFDQRARSISAGAHSTCAISHEGSLYCWGCDLDTLNTNTDTCSTMQELPSAVGAASKVSQVSVGFSHACYVSDEKVYCWGLAADGRLGGSATSNVAKGAPVGVDIGGKKIVQVSAGRYNTCALTGEGDVYCWGSNAFWLLGNGDTQMISSATPVKVVLDDPASFVAVGDMQSCAIASTGVYCWGAASQGSLVSSIPVHQTGFDGKGVKQLSIGMTHGCALGSTEALFCWGMNQGGQLGINVADQLFHAPERVTMP